MNIFEKHFKLQNQNCVDAPVSIDPKKFIELKKEANLIDKIKVKVHSVLKIQKNSLNNSKDIQNNT